MLLEHGADTNAVNGDKETSLHAAAHYGDPKPVEVNRCLYTSPLGRVLVSIDATTSFCLKVLLDHGAETEATDEEGFTPLLIACDNGSEEAAEVFPLSLTLLMLRYRMITEFAIVIRSCWKMERTSMQEASTGRYLYIVHVFGETLKLSRYSSPALS